MSMFWEFFTFELRFRRKSISTYVYFLVWLAFSFLCVASENFGPVGNLNGKVLLNGPYAITYNDFGACLFGIIIIAAIFGTSILRDFQRDTYQILFTKPISKFAYLGGRWAGSFVTTVLVYTGMMIGTYAGTFAPWADHTRIGRITFGGMCSHFFPWSSSRSSFLARSFLRLRLSQQNLRRLPPGRCSVHGVHHRDHRIFGNSIAGTFLVRHLRSRRPDPV